MLANNFSTSTSTCFAIFELIKFMCFGSTLSYLHKESLNLPRTKYNPLMPHSKFNPPCTCSQSSVGSCTHPANVGTRNLPCAGLYQVPKIFLKKNLDYIILAFICLMQMKLKLCNAFISKHIVY